MWVGLIRSAEGLNRTKRLTFPWVRRNSSSLTPELRHWPFPAFRLRLKYQLFLGLEPKRLWTKTRPSTLGSPVCHLQILGLVSLHNHVSQFLGPSGWRPRESSMFQFMCKGHLLTGLPLAGGGQSFVLSRPSVDWLSTPHTPYGG